MANYSSNLTKNLRYFQFSLLEYVLIIFDDHVSNFYYGLYGYISDTLWDETQITNHEFTTSSGLKDINPLFNCKDWRVIKNMLISDFFDYIEWRPEPRPILNFVRRNSLNNYCFCDRSAEDASTCTSQL